MTNLKVLSGDAVSNPDGNPQILRACYASDQVETVKNFFKETGLAQEARVEVDTLLFVTHTKGIPLNTVLEAFRKHGVDEWKQQPERYRGNPFGCPRAISTLNCQIFYSVYLELGLLVPAEFATGRIHR